jgi:hypothetical protein
MTWVFAAGVLGLAAIAVPASATAAAPVKATAESFLTKTPPLPVEQRSESYSAILNARLLADLI